MSQFWIYFGIGREHILDLNGYDHILFVIALCAIYILQDWKRVLILVTAFTIGHSITLALSTLNILNVRTDLIEFLIPVTILITAIANLFKTKQTLTKTRMTMNYAFALFFGLIHGMGFSNYLKSILGKEDSIVSPLLAFNLGLELGQIIIVVIFMIASFVFVSLFSVQRRDWNLIISSAVAGMALMLMFDAKFW